MFEQLKLRGTFGEMSRRLKISNVTHAVLWRGISRYVKEMKRRGLDPDQALVFMLSDSIVNGAANGSLEKFRVEFPQVYSDLRTLWVFCGAMLEKDYDRFANVMIVPADH